MGYDIIERFNCGTSVENTTPEEIAAEESSDEQGASDTAATEIPAEEQQTEDAPQKFENVDVAPEIVEIEDAKVKGRTHKKSYGPFIAAFLILAGIIAIICFTVIPEKINESNYNQAAEHMSNKEYELAVDVYAELGDYEDSAEKLKLAKYNLASQLEAQENYNEAKKIYTELGNYEDSMAKASSCTYNIALAMLDGGKFDEAKKLFESIPDYLDSKEKSKECDYQKGISYIDAKEYATAIDIFTALGDYSESKTKILDAKYKYVSDHPSKDDKTTIAYLKDLIEARYEDKSQLFVAFYIRTDKAFYTSIITNEEKCFIFFSCIYTPPFLIIVTFLIKNYVLHIILIMKQCTFSFFQYLLNKKTVKFTVFLL